MAAGGCLLRRLLFAMPNPSDCLVSCDPACLYYHLCPLPIPASPLAPPDDDYNPGGSVSTNIVLHPHHSSPLLPALPIVAASLLAGVLLLFVAFYVRLLILRRRRRRRTAAAALALAHGGAAPSGNFFDGAEADHHVWYIRTVGLDESTIGAITAWAYKADDGVLSAATADCAVCLAEFREGEVLRLLPKCGHAFHLACIDTWLRSHVNCPLCRAPVVAPGSNNFAPAGDGSDGHDGDSGTSSLFFSSPSSLSDGSDPVNPNSCSLVPIDTIQRTNWSSRTTREVSDGVVEDGRLEIGPQNGVLINPVPNVQLLMMSTDLGQYGFRPIQRSASMDSLPLAASKGGFPPKEFERSLSSGGRRLS